MDSKKLFLTIFFVLVSVMYQTNAEMVVELTRTQPYSGITKLFCEGRPENLVKENSINNNMTYQWQWRHNNKMLDNSGRFSIESEATNTTLKMTGFSDTDAGEYTCFFKHLPINSSDFSDWMTHTVHKITLLSVYRSLIPITMSVVFTIIVVIVIFLIEKFCNKKE